MNNTTTVGAEWQDRAATDEEVSLAHKQAADALLPGVPKPIMITISNLDVKMLAASRTSPEGYMQCILAALKDAGAPVEGVLKLKLAHGAVARVKPNPMVDEGGFKYVWLAPEYVAAIAKGGV